MRGKKFYYTIFICTLNVQCFAILGVPSEEERISEKLTLPGIVERKEKNNDVKTEIQITDGSLVTDKINLLDITVLNLPNCHLQSIPQELSTLENVRVLNLSNNKLTEPPECLEKNLKFIEYLDLSYNNLNDFEREPACRVRLKVLLLNDNNLLNIPEWILYVRCFNLEEFNFSYNKVNRLYASQFNVKSNYKLKRLLLQSCCFLEKDFKYINGMKTLEYLDVSNQSLCQSTNVISGEILFKNPDFSEKLTILKLNYLSLSVLSDNIACLVNLKELYLVCNNLSWLPDSLITLSNLEILDVSENFISFLPENFYKLLNLKKFVAHSNILSQLPDLSKMKQLHYLDLYKNRLFEFVFAIDSFNYLDLEQNCFKTNEKLASYQDYTKKRENLRSAGKLTCRCDSAIFSSESEQDSCSSESILSEIDENCDDELEWHVNVNDAEESWDDYNKSYTTSDDEWRGCEPPWDA